MPSNVCVEPFIKAVTILQEYMDEMLDDPRIQVYIELLRLRGVFQ